MSRLAFQTQLASIMEVLANAAVAEICKLVDDDYAVVSLQMSQCQRENKALKRKLHLLELKMARGNAERRLRESAMNSSRSRVQIHGDRLRESSPSSGVFERRIEVAVWPGKAAAGRPSVRPVHSDSVQSKSPDVELVEPEVLLVKEEKVEANLRLEEAEENSFIGEDGVVEGGAAGQDTQSTSSQTRGQIQSSRTRHTGSSSRGVEVSDSSPLLSCELSACVRHSPQQYVDDASSDSHFDVLCDSDKSANLLVEEFFDEVEVRKASCSYSMAAADFPSTSASMNGWMRYGPGAPPSQPISGGGPVQRRPGTKERLFVCSYCGKAFNRPKKEEVEPDVVLVKVEEGEPGSQKGFSIQEGLVESSTDDYRAVLPFEDITQTTNQLSDLQESGRGFSEVSYGHSSLWTNGGVSYCNDDSLPGPSSHCAPLSFPPSTIDAEHSEGRGLALESSRGFHTSGSFGQQNPVIDLSEDSGPSEVSGQMQEPQLFLGPSAATQSMADPGSVAAVQLRVPDTISAANSRAQQQQRSSTRTPPSSEYSLFELETFFTRWAPDSDSGSSGPSFPFPADDSAECDQNGVIIVESETQPQPVAAPGAAPSGERMGVWQSSSSNHIQPSVSHGPSAETSASTPLRVKAPLSQPPWSRKAVLIRGAQSELQQHGDSSRASQQQHSLPSAQTSAAVSNTKISSISSTSRTMSSTVAPYVRRFLGRKEVPSAEEHRVSLLAHHNISQAPGILLSEHRKKGYVCRACGKAFTGLSNLEAHERVHTGEKPYRCDTCGKRFSEAGNLKKHQRVHTGEKPFSCQQCGKRFAWICNLRTHQQSATGCGLQAGGRLGLG
ncbi:hypothetical protein PBY51_020791 [Eleginops maclovinus]|uniref:C2H2-type domain-containing protein n=1 Tax=Eleginops maclovinus TaxID=56733 RepID=A0AAN7XQU4_ELEMC|nr:hypothetical protein PBY51_020791 [Eleginops maclovinus]